MSLVSSVVVSLYFPPAGGGGVQRPLKFATHLPGLGIETHVLAPDDPKWIHADDDLPPPTRAWVHRARYLGPKGRKPAEELHGKQGLERVARRDGCLRRCSSGRERDLEPDRDPGGDPDRRAREGIDVVLTTSPPSSVHLVGAAVKRATGARWIADLRDSLVAHPHRRAESALVRVKEQGEAQVAKLVGAAGGRDRLRRRRDRGGDAGLRAARPRGHDRERLRLRRLRRPRAPRRPTASGSRTPARSSASARRARSSRRWPGRGSRTSSRASSATSGARTASGPKASASATGSS